MKNAAIPITALELLQRKRRKRPRDSNTRFSTTQQSQLRQQYDNAVVSSSSSAYDCGGPPPLPLLLIQNKNNHNHNNERPQGIRPQAQTRISNRHNQRMQQDISTTTTSTTTNTNPTAYSTTVGLPQWLLLNKSNGHGVITEISGEAGAGKSQLCLSLCVSCVLSTSSNKTRMFSSSSPSLSLSNTMPSYTESMECPHEQSSYYHAMYITLGGEGDQTRQIAQRLYQIIDERCFQTHNTSSAPPPTTSNNNNNNVSTVKEIMKRIHIRHVHNEDELLELIQKDLPPILQRCNNHNSNNSNSNSNNNHHHPFGLLIFDSIAGIFRTREHSTTNTTTTASSSSSYSYYYAKRSERMFTIASQLKKLSDMFHVHIIVVNQVTTVIEKRVVSLYNYPNYNRHNMTTSNHHSNSRSIQNPYNSSSTSKTSSSNSSGMAKNSTDNTHSTYTTTYTSSSNVPNHNDHQNHKNVMNRRIVERMVLKPSLGLSWSHCVNDRYMVSRREKCSSHVRGSNCSSNIGTSGTGCGVNGGSKQFIRTLKLYSSSTFDCQTSEVKYAIEPHGVVMLS